MQITIEKGLNMTLTKEQLKEKIEHLYNHYHGLVYQDLVDSIQISGDEVVSAMTAEDRAFYEQSLDVLEDIDLT
jgi:hypothetical protein